MDNTLSTHQLKLHPHDHPRLANLCGLYDEHLRFIESALHVTLCNRGHAGFGSTIVITGDLTQTDLHAHQKFGLEHAIRVLKQVKKVSFMAFKADDVVRHPLVQALVEAYDTYEKKAGHD